MNKELPQILEGIKAVSGDAKKTFGDFSGEQLNWKPSEDAWSIAQCFDHLIKSNKAFDTRFEELANGSRKQSLLERYSPFTSFFENLLLKSIKNDAKKFKAPSKAIVPPSEIEPDIIERFCAHQVALSDNIKSVDGVDWQKTVVTSPFFRILTYRLNKAYEIAVEHEKRHVRQAKRVMESDNFPG